LGGDGERVWGRGLILVRSALLLSEKLTSASFTRLVIRDLRRLWEFEEWTNITWLTAAAGKGHELQYRIIAI